VADLAFALHVGERADRILERHFRVHRVQLVEVDALELQALQAAGEISFKLLRAAIGIPAAGARSGQTALGRDHQPLRIGMERLGDQHLVGARPVALRRVDELHAELDRPAQHP